MDDSLENMILVTGATGQIGSDLVPALQKRYGMERIISCGRNLPRSPMGRFEILDVTDRQSVLNTVSRHGVTTIYHLAGILSAKGERHPEDCWQVNIHGLRNILEAARVCRCRVFWPSSIAAFGPRTPKQNTPQEAVLDPVTLYGITKATGEYLCQYYFLRHGVDVRSLRFPGIISYRTHPGGGTTDYAVEIFHEALAQSRYHCFVRSDTRLPMLYMPDALDSIFLLMKSDPACITVRTSYNVTGISFTVLQLAEEIRKHLPDFEIFFQPDDRQQIADSWPSVIDDSQARLDWGWRPSHDLAGLVKDMLSHLARRKARKGKKNE
ncbi:MAG: NAD-dependent epimerase/dehydratase family protein [Desulfuromonadaceae bacterium]|nr:NAD-dependent epimerase/dehydratase family protein [Desulfuromonadaceae bacterium]